MQERDDFRRNCAGDLELARKVGKEAGTLASRRAVARVALDTSVDASRGSVRRPLKRARTNLYYRLQSPSLSAALHGEIDSIRSAFR